jgi:hypothetical protein
MNKGSNLCTEVMNKKIIFFIEKDNCKNHTCMGGMPNFKIILNTIPIGNHIRETKAKVIK